MLHLHLTITFLSFHFSTPKQPSLPRQNLSPLPHFTALRCIFYDSTTLHFASSISSSDLSPKLLALQERVPRASAGSWFQGCVVLFAKECLLISAPNVHTRKYGLCSLSPVAFQARAPVYALKRAHVRD
jgi:hypothetical protein